MTVVWLEQHRRTFRRTVPMGNASAGENGQRTTLTGAAAAGHTRLGPELAELNTLRAAHGDQAFADALDRAVAFGRWRAADVRSILAAGPGTADPRPAGDALVLELPVVPVRPLADYAIGGLS
jgi:phage tail protein X